MNGIIAIKKEAGYTSHDVVAKLRGIVKQKKIGHTGTLDPDAVGVLPVCLGNATKLCDMLTDKSKEYEADMLLGVTTDTQDMSGTILSRKPVEVDEEAVREAVMSFVGTYQQIPPMYSAIKVNGRKLYELAREGKEIERKPRQVEIMEIVISRIQLPKVTFRVSCSKGTYIRTLCTDIGERLGCGAAMEHLTRTRAGNFTLADSYTLAEIEELTAQGRLEEKMILPEQVLAEYDAVLVRPEYDKALANGNKLYQNQLDHPVWTKMPDQMFRVYSSEKCFTGVYQYSSKEDCLKPYKMFLE